MKKILTNVVLVFFLAAIWAVMLGAFDMLLIISPIIQYLGNGILKYVFAIVFLIAVILPVIFRKRMTKHISLPIVLIICTVASVVINSFIYFGSMLYVSEYSRPKWDNNRELRIYMVNDLENECEIIGKTESEIIELLGEPTNIPDYGVRRYEYYISTGFADVLTYDVIFKNGIATETTINEH